MKDETYSTTKALPVIFPTERFYGLRAIPDDVLALFAPRRAQPDMT
jgi:hypothetical protein